MTILLALPGVFCELHIIIIRWYSQECWIPGLFSSIFSQKVLANPSQNLIDSSKAEYSMTGVLQLWQALIDFDTMLKQYKLSQKKTGRYQIENVNIKYYDYVIFRNSNARDWNMCECYQHAVSLFCFWSHSTESSDNSWILNMKHGWISWNTFQFQISISVLHLWPTTGAQHRALLTWLVGLLFLILLALRLDGKVGKND